MDRYVRTASLKEIRPGTRSQWRLMSAGVMCSNRRILKVSRAAAFWIDWRRWMRLAGSPNSSLLFSSRVRVRNRVRLNVASGLVG